jgi:antitoxin MazE
MRARIVRIGNSRGIRLPKPLLEQVGLAEEVELEVRDGAIVITPGWRPRRGWAQAARAAADQGDDRMLDAPTTTEFDREQWNW